MKRYYDLHVFYSRKDGFSVPVEIETDEEMLTDEEVIEFAEKNGLIDDSDSNQFDYVGEIELNEYNDMKGI